MIQSVIVAGERCWRLMGVTDSKDLPGAGLGLLARLATPLWLLGASGCAIWLNESARSALQMKPESAPATVVAAISDDVLATLAAVPAGSRIFGSVTFRSDDLETVITCHLSMGTDLIPEAPGRTAILAEAVTDPVVRREAMRLNEQLIAISDAFPDLRCLLRRDGTILDLTVTAGVDLGLVLDRFLDRPLPELIPLAARDRFEAALDQVGGRASVVGFDYSLPLQDGTGYFDARLVNLPDEQRLMLVVRNVTAQRRAELAALAAGTRLADVIEALDVAAVLFDGAERLICCNRRYRSYLKISADLLVPGRPVEEILRESAILGQFPMAEGQLDEWLATRLMRHRDPDCHGAGFEEVLVDGRRLWLRQCRTSEGGVIGFATELTAPPIGRAAIAAPVVTPLF